MVAFAGLRGDKREATDGAGDSSDTPLPAVVLPVPSVCLGEVDIKNMDVFRMGTVLVQPSNQRGFLADNVGGKLLRRRVFGKTDTLVVLEVNSQLHDGRKLLMRGVLHDPPDRLAWPVVAAVQVLLAFIDDTR